MQGRVPWYALRHLALTWAAALHSQLAGAAPWLLAIAAQDAPIAERPLRLLGLGGQNIARKPALFLARPSAGRPRLVERGQRATAARGVASSGLQLQKSRRTLAVATAAMAAS